MKTGDLFKIKDTKNWDKYTKIIDWFQNGYYTKNKNKIGLFLSRQGNCVWCFFNGNRKDLSISMIEKL